LTKRKAIDTGTAELSQHHKLVPELTDAHSGYAFRVRVRDQTLLDQMLMDEVIDADSYFLLDKFANDLYKAGLVGIKASDYEPKSRRTGDGDLATSEALKKLIVSQAISYLDKKVGKNIRFLTVKVCLDELDEFKPAWKRHIDLAIDALQGYYG
jgi:hypothetical protein